MIASRRGGFFFFYLSIRPQAELRLLGVAAWLAKGMRRFQHRSGRFPKVRWTDAAPHGSRHAHLSLQRRRERGAKTCVGVGFLLFPFLRMVLPEVVVLEYTGSRAVSQSSILGWRTRWIFLFMRDVVDAKEVNVWVPACLLTTRDLQTSMDCCFFCILTHRQHPEVRTAEVVPGTAVLSTSSYLFIASSGFGLQYSPLLVKCALRSC